MKTYLDIYKDFTRRTICVRAIKYEMNESFILNSGSWIKFKQGERIQPTIELPYETEIKTDEGVMEYAALLKQKDNDKNQHIDDLNGLLGLVVEKLKPSN